MKRKFVLILIFLIILFLIAVAVYNRNTLDSKIQKTADISAETSLAANESLSETSSETLEAQTSGTSAATTTEATQTTDTSTAATASTTSTASTSSTAAESSSEITEPPTAQEIDKNLPTLKLTVTEGPVIIPGGDLVYYRVEARVTGTPFPFIKFSRDDSGGVWGKNIAQINLKSGESYDLVVTATNASGFIKKHIVLTWNPATTDSL